jgi:hypothetical protein
VPNASGSSLDFTLGSACFQVHLPARHGSPAHDQ